MDITDKATRSRMMASVRVRNTRPELVLRKALRDAGILGYRLHRRDVPGSPDIAWLGAKVAVFVDGAFWHGHPSAFTPGKSGEFWDRKIAANQERDRRVDRELEDAGWVSLRFWDFEVYHDTAGCVSKIRSILEARRRGVR